jgi:phosphoribosylformimino-5-aminoimidazole carboxamide ribotide isomerase
VIVVPSIDILGGRCVRLTQGDYSRERVYENDATAVVHRILESGARRVHLVDLDAARGKPDPLSTRAVEAVLASLAGTPVVADVGGGVRDLETARRWLGSGAGLVVLGSVAVSEPDIAQAICEALPGKCFVALDVRGDIVQSQGWTEDAGSAASHLVRWVSWPLAGLIRTTVAADGMMGGPDLAGLEETVRAFPGPVLASGGIASIDDMARCAEVGAAGAIVGRAIYEGSFDLRAAIQRFPQ